MCPYLIAILCIATFACSDKQHSIQDLLWLQGSWKSVQENNYCEVWLFDNNQLKGISYTFKNNTLVPSEYLTITLSEEGNLVYIAQVNNQNNGQAIGFNLKHHASNKWVFENKSHDFPQRITYFKQAGNAIRIVVDGKIDGKYSKQDWLLQKTNTLNLR
jgi:hypothetical protein